MFLIWSRFLVSTGDGRGYVGLVRGGIDSQACCVYMELSSFSIGMFIFVTEIFL